MSDLMAGLLPPLVTGGLCAHTSESYAQNEQDFAQVLANANRTPNDGEQQAVVKISPPPEPTDLQHDAAVLLAADPAELSSVVTVDQLAEEYVVSDQAELELQSELTSVASNATAVDQTELSSVATADRLAEEYAVSDQAERQDLAVDPVLTTQFSETESHFVDEQVLTSTELDSEQAKLAALATPVTATVPSDSFDATKILAEFDALVQLKRQFDDTTTTSSLLKPTVEVVAQPWQVTPVIQPSASMTQPPDLTASMRLSWQESLLTDDVAMHKSAAGGRLAEAALPASPSLMTASPVVESGSALPQPHSALTEKPTAQPISQFDLPDSTTAVTFEMETESELRKPTAVAHKEWPNISAMQINTLQQGRDQNIEGDLSVERVNLNQADAVSLDELQSLTPSQHSSRVLSASPMMADPALLRSSVSAQRLAPELNERLSVMINTEQMSAELQLDPPELGALQVRVQMNGDQALVQMQVQNAQARDLLEQSLAQLKEMLAEQGIQLADAHISDGSSEHANEQEHEAGSTHEMIEEGEVQQLSGRNAEGGIDYYA